MKKLFQIQKTWKKKISFTLAILAIGSSVSAQFFTPGGVTPAVLTNNSPIVVHGASSGNGTGIGLSFGGGGIYIGKGCGSSATQNGYNLAIGNAVSYTSPITFDAIPLASLQATSLTSGPVTANFNLAIGTSVLRFITTSNYNTGIGQAGVLGALTSGDGNTAVGAGSMANFTSGTNNTGFGVSSLRGGVGASGSNNTALGSGGLANVTSGSSNLGLGVGSLANVNSGSSNVGLGLGANVEVGTNSNQLSVMNVIYGSNMSSAALGNVGIGLFPSQTASGLQPVGTWSKLQIGGSGTMPSLRLMNVPTASVLSGRSYLFVDAAGVVTQAQIPAGGTTTNALTSSANIMTSNVNGVIATAPIINSVSNSYNSGSGALTTTVNGITSSSVTIPNINIYNSNGALTGSRAVDMNNQNLWFNTTSSTTNGRIYIGASPLYPTTTGNYRLYVEGGILTEKVKVAIRTPATNWADYVFEKDYKLMPIKTVETFIRTNKHLPGINAADDLVKNGLDLGEMQAKQMAKIEELTLYLIDQNKSLEKQQAEINELKATVEILLKKIK